MNKDFRAGMEDGKKNRVPKSRPTNNYLKGYNKGYDTRQKQVVMRKGRKK